LNDKEAVFAALDGSPLPTVPLTKDGLGDATIAENADELLDHWVSDSGNAIEIDED
jgi:hypothetical protein